LQHGKTCLRYSQRDAAGFGHPEVIGRRNRATGALAHGV
jgi:hypothetical protein